MMYALQIVMALALILCGMLVAVFSDLTIGIIGSVGGVTMLYLTITEKRNQPRRWS